MKNKNIKLDDTEIKKQKFYRNKIPISIKDKDINKIVISNMLHLGKQHFIYFIGYMVDKKLDLYAYSFHKQVHIEQILVRLYLFYDKRKSF